MVTKKKRVTKKKVAKSTTIPKQSGLAVAALVLGIIGLLMGFVPAVLAIIFGAMRKEEKFGRIGMILGIIGVVIWAVVFVILMIMINLALSGVAGNLPI